MGSGEKWADYKEARISQQGNGPGHIRQEQSTYTQVKYVERNSYKIGKPLQNMKQAEIGQTYMSM
jgi:hypothetical protein